MSAEKKGVLRRRRLPPIDYTLGMPWCVLRFSELDMNHGVELDLQSEAIVLDIDPEDVDSVSMLLENMNAELEASREHGGLDMPPFVALLSAPVVASGSFGFGSQSSGSRESAWEAREKLLSVQARLQEMGLDEVVLKTGNVYEVHFSISLAIHRSAHRQIVQGRSDQNAREEEKTRGRLAVLALEKELLARWAEDLWLHVGDLSATGALPPMDASLPGDISAGAAFQGLRLEGILGRGAFGTVVLAHNIETSEVEAVKVFSKRRHTTVEALVTIAREVETLRKLEHENVARILGVMHSRRHLLVRVEYAGPRSLMRLLCSFEGNHIDLPWAQDLYRQFSAGLAYCHGQGVAHCDLKPENLAVDDPGRRLRILDFGCSARVDALLKEPRGTMPFLAPEVLLRGAYSPAAADVWSGGVVLLEMAAGIGALNRVMGWPKEDIAMSPEAGEQLLALLDNPATIQAAIMRRAGPSPPELVELLSGVFAAREVRSSSAEVALSPWLARSSAAFVDSQPSAPPPRPCGEPGKKSFRRKACAPTGPDDVQ